MFETKVRLENIVLAKGKGSEEGIEIVGAWSKGGW